MSKNQMKLKVIYIWFNRGRTVSILQKLVAMPKIIQSQDSKTTFKPNLICIFLSGRANLKYPLCYDGPCSTPLNSSLWRLRTYGGGSSNGGGGGATKLCIFKRK